MPAIDTSQRRWLAVFGLTLAGLIGLALVLYLRIPGYRDPAFDFRTLRPDEILVTHGLTRRQDGSLKLGFAESHPPPEIGAYGNHVIVDFGADALGGPHDPGYFFNYAYANLALPEIHAYLLHLERRGRLPKRLMLIQITTPNNDNGHFIVNWGNELPPDVILGALASDGLGSLGQTIAVAWQVLRNELHEVLNYNTAILGAIQGGPDGRVISEADCRGVDPPAWLMRMPWSVRGAFGSYAGRSFYCLPQNWVYGYRRDGSTALVRSGAVGVDKLVQDENPLDDAGRALNAGDEHRIVHYLRAIDAIGRRHGIQVVFLVPPVYESDRHASVVNQVFNRALALAPEIAIIDHRGMNRDATLFRNYNHPSRVYFRLVGDELRRRGFIE
jgi:hypothetical protein